MEKIIFEINNAFYTKFMKKLVEKFNLDLIEVKKVYEQVGAQLLMDSKLADQQKPFEESKKHLELNLDELSKDFPLPPEASKVKASLFNKSSKNIRKEYEMISQKLKSNPCVYRFSRGKRKGELCGVKPRDGGSFCASHKKHAPKNKKASNKSIKDVPDELRWVGSNDNTTRKVNLIKRTLVKMKHPFESFYLHRRTNLVFENAVAVGVLKTTSSDKFILPLSKKIIEYEVKRFCFRYDKSKIPSILSKNELLKLENNIEGDKETSDQAELVTSKKDDYPLPSEQDELAGTLQAKRTEILSSVDTSDQVSPRNELCSSASGAPISSAGEAKSDIKHEIEAKEFIEKVTSVLDASQTDVQEFSNLLDKLQTSDSELLVDDEKKDLKDFNDGGLNLNEFLEEDNEP